MQKGTQKLLQKFSVMMYRLDLKSQVVENSIIHPFHVVFLIIFGNGFLVCDTKRGKVKKKKNGRSCN